MSTYTAENVKDLDITTPTESSTPPSEVNNSDREIKDVIKNQWATIVKSAAYTLTPQDSLILVSGTTTITIPASTDVSSSTFFKEYTIIKTDAAGTNITIARTGSDTFNGATSITLTKQYEGAKIFGSGVADWKYLPVNDLVAGTDYLTPTGDGSGLTGISISDTITNVTGATTALVAADCTGRKEYTNWNSVVINNFNLPAAAANLKVRLRVTTGNATVGIKWSCNGTETAYMMEDTTLANCTSNTQGSIWELACEQTDTSTYKWRARLTGNQPSVKIRDTSLSMAANANTKIPMTEIEDWDNNNSYTLADAKWTPAIPGRYNCTLTVALTASGGTYYSGIFKIWKSNVEDTTFQQFHQTNSGANGQHTIHYLFKVTTITEYYEWYLNASSDAATIVNHASGVQFLEIDRISD